MNSDTFYVDIHCHPTIRAYNTAANGEHTLWENVDSGTANTTISRWARMQTREIAKHSQSNFYTAAEGKVRVLFDSLYPVEKGFLNFRKVPSVLMGRKNSEEVMQTVTGLNISKMRQLQNQEDYFTELRHQYEHLANGQGHSPCQSLSYRLVNDYHQLKHTLNAGQEHIAIIVNIEGAHAFGCGTELAEQYSDKELKKKLSKNIASVKSWQHSPFSVNLAHHFWNQLCGHARSFKPAIHAAYNQTVGINGGITSLGWHVIRELLTRRNGRRILIDIKHMSAKSRREYYRFIEQYNYINPDDTIPILCSHTGVSGYKDLKAGTKKPDNQVKLKKGYFHGWSINLADEELRIIHESGGLIGIMMDKGLLGSLTTIEKIRQIADSEAKHEAYVQLVLNSVFHIVKTIGKRAAWNTISIGTDYDGLITHIDPYDSAAKLANLHQDLLSYLKKYNYQKDLWFGYEPEEMVYKIMNGNAMKFLKKHFYNR